MTVQNARDPEDRAGALRLPRPSQIERRGMDLGLVPCPDRSHGRSRRQDVDLDAPGSWLPPPVAAGHHTRSLLSQHEMSFSSGPFVRDEHAVREFVQSRREGLFRAHRSHPLGMEPVVDRPRPDRVTGGTSTLLPDDQASRNARNRATAALEAQAMTRSQPSGFVEEE